MNLFRLTVLAALLQTTLIVTAHSDEFVVPTRMTDEINLVLASAASETPRAKNPADVVQALGALHRLVDRETAAAAEKWEGVSMAAKVIWLAGQHSAQPSKLEEIHGYYFKNGLENGPQFAPGIRPRIYLGPELREEHVSEEYRAAWETLALLKHFESSLDRNDELLMMALSRIGNPKSAVLIGYRCNPAGRPTSAEPASELFALAALPDSETIRVLLRVLAEWKKAHPELFERQALSGNISGLTLPEESPRDARLAESGTLLARTCEALERRSAGDRQIAEKWQGAFKEFPLESLAPPDRKLFSALATSITESR